MWYLSFLKFVLIQHLYKFEPTATLATQSMNAERFFTRKRLTLLLPLLLLLPL